MLKFSTDIMVMQKGRPTHWRIQSFPEEGATAVKVGRHPIILPIIPPKTAWK